MEFELVSMKDLLGNYGESAFDFLQMDTICKEFNTDAYSISIWKSRYEHSYHIFIDNFKKGFFEINVCCSKFAVRQVWDSGERLDMTKCPVWIRRIVENNCY